MDIVFEAQNVFDKEIQGLQIVKNNINQELITIANILLTCKGKIIITGVGKSGHIAKKIAATLASTGTPSFFIHPSEALHGDLGMIDDKDVVIAISYSGEADELMAMLLVIKKYGNTIIGMSGNIHGSRLAKIANHMLSIFINEEACPFNLAPTSSTTASLVMGDALAIVLLKLRKFAINDFAKSHPSGALGRKLLMTNKDIMHTDDELPAVQDNSNLKTIILEISQKGLGFTAVINYNKEIIGVITDGDLRRAMDNINDNNDFKNIDAVSIMTKMPKLINENALAIDTAHLMQQHKITGILVTNDNLNLVGAINIHDLLQAKLL